MNVDRTSLGPFSPELQSQILDFLEMLASEPFAGTPSTTDDAKRLLRSIEADQKVGR